MGTIHQHRPRVCSIRNRDSREIPRNVRRSCKPSKIPETHDILDHPLKFPSERQVFELLSFLVSIWGSRIAENPQQFASHLPTSESSTLRESPDGFPNPVNVDDQCVFKSRWNGESAPGLLSFFFPGLSYKREKESENASRS